MQSMGFRELVPYLVCRDVDYPASKRDVRRGRSSAWVRARVLEACMRNLVVKHRQYGASQRQWIRKKVLPRDVAVYKLDTSR